MMVFAFLPFLRGKANLRLLFWKFEPIYNPQENFSFPRSKSKNNRKSEAKLYKG
jgi:hypothetical protein